MRFIINADCIIMYNVLLYCIIMYKFAKIR